MGICLCPSSWPRTPSRRGAEMVACDRPRLRTGRPHKRLLFHNELYQQWHQLLWHRVLQCRPGHDPRGQTTITITYYHTSLQPSGNPQYALFDQFVITRARSDGPGADLPDSRPARARRAAALAPARCTSTAAPDQAELEPRPSRLSRRGPGRYLNLTERVCATAPFPLAVRVALSGSSAKRTSGCR